MNALYQRTGNVASIPRIQTTGRVLQSLKPATGIGNRKCCDCEVTGTFRLDPEPAHRV